MSNTLEKLFCQQRYRKQCGVPGVPFLERAFRRSAMGEGMASGDMTREYRRAVQITWDRICCVIVMQRATESVFFFCYRQGVKV